MAEESKMFSKGPWEWYNNLSGEKIGISDGEKDVLYVNHSESIVIPREKDAHLIAAAPDLYEALSDLVGLSARLDFSEGYCCCGDDVKNHGIGTGHSPVDAGDYYSMQTIETARAALSKARGES